MFRKLSSIYRLSLCLLLSIGAHGALAFYALDEAPAKSALEHAPVFVSLQPALEASSATSVDDPPTSPDSAPSRMRPPVIEHEPSREAPKPSSQSVNKKSVKVLTKKPLAVVGPREPRIQAMPTDVVCMTPQEVRLDNPLKPFADPQVSSRAVDQAVTNEENSYRGVPSSLRKDKGALLDSSPIVTPFHPSEAIPDYHSNPLPEYPRLARQRHWQGVVWLLVDVSADGSVEDLLVEQSCGHLILDRAARRAVSRWQFFPAKRAGLAVSSQVRLPIKFRLDDG